MVSKLNKSIGVVFLVLLALMLTPMAGWSQGYGAGQQAGQSEVSASEIASFAKAQSQIAKIRQEYQKELSAAEDQAQQESIVQEMNEKMVDAVEREGLSVEQYNDIFGVAQSDPAVQQRISEVMQDL